MLFRQYMISVKKMFSPHNYMGHSARKYNKPREFITLLHLIFALKKKKREICFRTDAIRNTLSVPQSLSASTVDI